MTSAQRARLRTFPYLLRALVPLTLLVVFAVIFAWPRGDDTAKVQTIDPAPAIAQAQARAPYDLLVPPSSGPGALGDGWRPTSTRIDAGPASNDPFVFRIGYVTPAGQYATFLESNDAPAAVVASIGATRGQDTETIDGVDWTRASTVARGETVLSRTAGEVTLVVTGSAALDELRTLAGSLR